MSEARPYSPPSYNTAIRQHGSHPASNQGLGLRSSALSHTQLLNVGNDNLDTTPPRSPIQRESRLMPVKAKSPILSPVSAYIKGQAPAKPRLAVTSLSPLVAELKDTKRLKPPALVPRKPFKGGGPSIKVPAVPLPLPGKKAKVPTKPQMVARDHQQHPSLPTAGYTRHAVERPAPPPPPVAPPPSPAATATGEDLLESQPLIACPSTTPRSSKHSLAGSSTHRIILQEVSTIDWSDAGLDRFNDELDWIKRKLTLGFPQDRSLHDAPWYSTTVKSHFVITSMSPLKLGEKSDQSKRIQVIDETMVHEGDIAAAAVKMLC